MKIDASALSRCRVCGQNPDKCACWLLTFLLAMWCFLMGMVLPGCVPSQPIRQIKPFETDGLDACLTIVVDMSGSFSEEWDDKAYNLFLELMDQFFTDGAGAESRIVIGQLSGNEKAVLFEGRPNDLRSRFRSPEELNTFLRERSDPIGSPVFKATEHAISYTASMPRITEETRLLTVILSDMADNTIDVEERRESARNLMKSLKQYRELGGGLALYYVAENQVVRWRGILDAAGFEPGSYVIESTLVAEPTLPRFD